MPVLSSLGLAILGALVVPATRGGMYPDCAKRPLKSSTGRDYGTRYEGACGSSSPCSRGCMETNEKLANLVNNSCGVLWLALSACQRWNEALHGAAHNRGITWGGGFSAATQFPQAITASATFHDVWIEYIGTIICSEDRAFANNGHAHLDF
ncbi:hypothetical protein VTH06DRAFT_3104 [Thermothelomyces fergusii]